MDKYTILFQIFLAAAIRVGLIYSQYRQTIADRVEVSTLLNSWKRMTEGVALYRHGISPYEGDIFHETPIALYLCDFMINNIPDFIGLVYVLVDILSGVMLYFTAKAYMVELEETQNRDKKTYAKGVENLLLHQRDYEMCPKYVLAAYLFNPYTILSCVGFTTTTFGNLCYSLLFFSMVKGNRLMCCASLALAVVQSFYPVILLVPICIYNCRNSSRRFLSIGVTITCFIAMLSLAAYACFAIMGDWQFVQAVYAVSLSVTDLRPNIGLFWYFFTEMFEHFRLLFIYSFQLNATLLYLAPLALRFHNDPMLLATSLTALIAIFKSYPCLGDVGFYMALLPMWKHLFNSKAVVPDMQQSFVILCALVITSVLGPTVWHLWIYSRSANANFYFGVTLAFATAQIFLITDVLFAYIKREFTLKHGIINEEQKAKLRLSLD
uniref:Phosphatidylinositol glycan anchor biosynthesis class U protein n=1 Tax=Lygus hesperus TaxID=30085 RepID=A0A146L6N0_LYGHE